MMNKQKVEKEYRKNIELGVIAALLICQTGFLMFRNQRLQIETAIPEQPPPRWKALDIIPLPEFVKPPEPPESPKPEKPKVEKVPVYKPVPVETEIPAEVEIRSIPAPVVVPTEGPKIPNYIPVDEDPSPVGGFEAIRANLKYPGTGRRLRLEGRVFIRVLIDENGEVAIVKIVKSSGYSFFDDAAVAALRTVKWNPGIQHDRPVKAWVSIPVHFKLR